MEEIRLGLEFQSALPRRERHNCDTIKNRALLISIRAPAKGATRWLCTSDADQVISIRAPAKGATCCQYTPSAFITISIRAPAKGATGDSLINALSGDISIRAPAKGATNARAYDRLH